MLRLIAPLLADPDRFGAAMDPKTSLQELVDPPRQGPAVSTSSATAAPTTRSASTRPCCVGGAPIATGDGSSKKQAEMAAALAAWAVLQRPKR